MRAIHWLGVLWLGLSGTAWADSLLLGAAAGYKKPVEALCQAFERENGVNVRRFYGNVAQILAQSERDGRVDVIIGDQVFLEKAGLSFAQRVDLGSGRAVLAWARGVTLERLEDLPRLERVTMPDPAQAIYGRAATEFLQHSGLEREVKLRVVGTVPQVAAYLVRGEIDAGFINLTEALALGDSIGGYLELPQASYTPIRIEAALVRRDENAAARVRLADFLATPEVRTLLARFGLY